MPVKVLETRPKALFKPCRFAIGQLINVSINFGRMITTHRSAIEKT